MKRDGRSGRAEVKSGRERARQKKGKEKRVSTRSRTKQKDSPDSVGARWARNGVRGRGGRRAGRSGALDVGLGVSSALQLGYRVGCCPWPGRVHVTALSTSARWVANSPLLIISGCCFKITDRETQSGWMADTGYGRGTVSGGRICHRVENARGDHVVISGIRRSARTLWTAGEGGG